MKRYRMFVDEVGNGRLGGFLHESNRRLTLVGIIMEQDVSQRELYPRIEALKANCFPGHPDDGLVVLHRKEIGQYEGPFCCLRRPKVRQEFETGLLSIYNELEYCVVLVTLDKRRHVDDHGSRAIQPYAYCMEVLLERFVKEMLGRQGAGDVMIEGTGKGADQKLRKAYQMWQRTGTGLTRMNVSPEQIQCALTSSELKVKPKSANVAGLQMVDLIAKPLERYVLAQEQSGLSEELASIAFARMRRSPSGNVDGWGLKFL